MATKRPWLRRLGWLAVIAAGGAAALWWLVVPRWARPTERERVVVTPDERAAEEARLRALGLNIPAGGVLLERPFEPPWTARSLLAPPSWAPAGVKKFLAQRAGVRADLLLADLDVLEAAMSRAYGGWDSAQVRGWDWAQWFGAWRARLRAAGTTRLSADDAFEPARALLAFQLDNHTQIPLGAIGTMSFSQTAVLASLPAAPCTEIRAAGGTFTIAPGDAATGVRRALRVHGDALEEAAYVAAPNARGALRAIHCGAAWIDLDVVSRGQTSLLARSFAPELFGHERPTIRALSPGVTYVRLPTMTPATYAHVEEDRPRWPQPTGHESAVIVDLRGNGGYSAGLGLDVLADWIPRSRLPPADAVSARVGTSCLAAPLTWGRDRQVLGPAASDRTRASLQRELDALALEAPEGCPRDVRETTGGAQYRAHHLNDHVPGPRIIAVVDNGCGSDCELLVLLLGALPETVVVGVNTAGVGGFIQPGYALLPHTGLPFRIALGRSDMYGDGRSFDGYGLDVDVVLPHPEGWSDGDLVRLAAMVARR